MRRITDRAARLGLLMLGLAFASPMAAGQSMSTRVGANARDDNNQIELLAIRAVHAELTQRGVTDWNTVGIDLNLDASLRLLRVPRDSTHARNLLAALGGLRFSRDSVRPNSPRCRPDSLTRLVYLSIPVVLNDSATVHVLYNIRDQGSQCRFFIESKNLSFVRRAGAWVYTGMRGGVVS